MTKQWVGMAPLAERPQQDQQPELLEPVRQMGRQQQQGSASPAPDSLES